MQDMPSPVSAVYEAGPTVFDRYRALMEAEIHAGAVAAPKPQRSSGQRVKTAARDTPYLTRWLRLDEAVAVSAPSVD